jgi:DNA polymerase-1
LVGADGVVHGRVNGNGAVTGRASHMKPNMAQIPKDAAVRSLWGPTRPGWLLVGCDAEGLEARVMAHYLAHWDNGAFAAKVLAGDFHTANFDVLAKVGMASRNGAKTWLYAFMYGAGDHKLGETIKGDARDNGKAAPRVPSRELGARSREMIAKAMVGIDKLSEAVKSRSKARGYLIGLDGRQLQVRSEHSALNTLLQGGGAVVMKKALQLFMQVHGDHHGTEFALCGNIHDEVQMECRADLAAAYGSSFAGCIREAGEHYKLRCPMAGKAAVGANWSETH